MAARVGDKLWPKHGEFYDYGGMESMVCDQGVYTAQLLYKNETGRSNPVTMPSLNGYPPCGRPECPDRVTAGPTKVGTGYNYRCSRPGVTYTTLLTLVPILCS